MRRYGLTVADWCLLRNRNPGCAICGRTNRSLVVDHCHDTGKVRGILCSPCNVALGTFRDSREVMERAINYVEQARAPDWDVMRWTDTGSDFDVVAVGYAS